MKAPKKSLLIFLLNTAGFFNVSAQDNPILDRVINWEETTYDFDSVNYFTLRDTAKKEPITGWVKINLKNKLDLRHYLNGKQDGYSVVYLKRKKTYRLSEISSYLNGEIQTRAFYSYKKQFSSDSGYSWGLRSFSIWNPDSMDKHLVSRTVKDIYKSIVIDYSYYPQSHTKYRHRYRSSNSSILMKNKVWNLGHQLFPYELNEHSDIFSFVRYDGYYFFNQRLKPGDQSGWSFFIRFLPNQSAVIIRKNELLSEWNDWNDSTSVTYKVDYLNNLNQTSNSFKVTDGERVILTGKIEPFGLFIEMPNYANGPFLRHFLNYVKIKESKP